MIVYSDNAAVLEVFDKPKAGIFAFLEEQCLIQTGKLQIFPHFHLPQLLRVVNFCRPQILFRLSFFGHTWEIYRERLSRLRVGD